MSSQVRPLVTVPWLKEAIAKKSANFQVLDVSWHMPAFNRNATKEFAEKHIPTAQFFEIDTYKSTLPTPEQFGKDASAVGVGNDTHVVVYDSNATFGMFSAPRAWWLFRYFGHENVSILDGGLPKWEEAGYETTAVVDEVEPITLNAIPNPALLRVREDIEANIEKKQFALVDGRPAGRFLGTAPEPNPILVEEITSGHIKGSVSLPFTLLIDPGTKLFKSPDAIREVLKVAAGDIDVTPMIATCGSGLTACFAMVGAYICGKQAVPLYDGSWTDYFLNGNPKNKVLPADT